MSSAFEDMNMEVCMEETPFEEAGDPGKGENGLPDGFMDSMDAFGENPFDSDGQEPDAASLPTQEETVSDGAWEDAEESDGPETDGEEETGEPENEREENSDAEEQSKDKKRAEHEAAEARRKAEWEARQQAKKEAEQVQLARLSSLSDEEVTAQAMKRVGSRYGKAYPPEYEGVRIRVYPDFMPGGPGFFQTDHASPQDHDPLLFLYQPESQGVCGAGDEG